MTIREYAETRGITYQAARNSIKRYSDELKDHITISYGMRVLDDFAVRFLDDHRRKSPVYISAETSEEFKSAQEKIEELRTKCEEVTEENRSLLKQIIVFQSKEKEYLSQIEQLQVQIEEKKSPEEVEEMRSRIRTAEAKKTSAESMAEELRTAKETAEAETERLKSDVQVAQAEAEQAKQAAETADQERQRLAEELAAEKQRHETELQAAKEQAAKDAAEAAETARRAERQKPWYKRLFGMD